MITVLGSTGFIGSYLVKYLKEKGIDCYCPDRNPSLFIRNLGDVICCVGMTADFRTRPYETVEAHVTYVNNFLHENKYESFVYLSSTRIYGIRNELVCENESLQVDPLNLDDIYNISKIMGESICYSHPNARVVRLSNVYGYDSKSENFVFTLIRDALKGKIALNTTLDSAKDHISVKDVVGILYRISISGRFQTYNVATGSNVTVRAITNKLKELTGCAVEVNKDAHMVRYPRISITRLKNEFPFTLSNILDDLPGLVEVYRKEINDNNR